MNIFTTIIFSKKKKAYATICKCSSAYYRMPTMICHVHIIHMSGIIKVHEMSHDILSYYTIFSRHRGHWHIRIANENCMSGKK
jgi:hypothetical protein